jgi:hypothetical protein
VGRSCATFDSEAAALPQDLHLAQARAAIAPLYRRAEPDALIDLAPAARLTPAERAAALTGAGALLTALRAPGRGGWIDRFLQEYSLSSEEGAALLGLAEAYLRVPDAGTADALIRDKLGRGDWRAHLGGADSVLVNSATLGLIIAQSLADASARGGALRWANPPSAPASPPPCSEWAKPSCSAATSMKRSNAPTAGPTAPSAIRSTCWAKPPAPPTTATAISSPT